MLSQNLTNELGKILQEELELELTPTDLSLLANDLADFFLTLFRKEENNEIEEK